MESAAFFRKVPAVLPDLFKQWEGLSNLERDRNGTKREYRLDRMEFLCALFGNPQDSGKTVHLAGSKGKGSTAVMGATVCSLSDGPVGLYTSPHLVDYTERFRILPQPPDTKEQLYRLGISINQRLSQLQPGTLPGGDYPTTFELLTLLAFLYFQHYQCRWVWLETGLGGRLDATNVLKQPEAVIITPIELEHRDFLGDSLAAIAGEKAGIMKPGVPVFLAEQPAEALEVFSRRAREMEAPLYYLPDYLESCEFDPAGDRQSCRFHWKEEATAYPASFTPSMLGDVQGSNGALALLCLKNILPGLSNKQLIEGLEQASLPGRGEIVQRNPLVVLDGAHTPHSLASVLEAFRILASEPSVLLFSCAADKDAQSLVKEISQHQAFSHIIVSRPGTFRASKPEETAAIFQTAGLDNQLIIPCDGAVNKALELAGEVGSILVCGSFYLAGEVASLLR